MVFCGKPSKACASCRKRKIKCDREQPICSQCARVGNACGGYQNTSNIRFRDETEVIIRKSTLQQDRFIKEWARQSAAAAQIHAPVNQNSALSSSIPVYHLTATLEDCASNFFFLNYMLDSTGLARLCVDYSPALYDLGNTADHLSASIKAVGFAGLYGTSNLPWLRRYATAYYIRALNLTNKALQRPDQVKKNSTLLSIMILAIYENVTGFRQRSLAAWTKHIHGAALVVKLRGTSQLRYPLGLRLFLEFFSNLLMDCIQRQIGMPQDVLDLRLEASRYIDTSTAEWLVQEAAIKFANFRADVRNRNLFDPQLILKKALRIDKTFELAFHLTPPTWKYETVFTDTDLGKVFSGSYHIYKDLRIINAWNGWRACRLLLHEIICNVIVQGPTSTPSIFISEENATLFNQSQRKMQELRHEVLASVPQHLDLTPGSVSQLSVFRPEESEGDSDTSDPVQKAFSASLWLNSLDDVSPTSNTHSPPQKLSPILPGNREPSLLWPLYLVGSMTLTSSLEKQRIADCMRKIGRIIGIQQGSLLADLLESKQPPEVIQNGIGGTLVPFTSPLWQLRGMAS